LLGGEDKFTGFAGAAGKVWGDWISESANIIKDLLAKIRAFFDKFGEA
jgi:hypothetical protein